MKRTIKRFERDGYTLVVDTTSGERVVKREYAATAKSKAVVVTMPQRKSTSRNAGLTPKRKNKKQRRGGRPNFLDCGNLDLDSRGRTTKHLCGGCPGGQATTVYQCDLYGDCAPMAWAEVPEKTVRVCANCKSYAPESGE